jgi:broad specificity phosphatase PhoE
MQCVEAKEELQKLKPDLILVSPLNRALATCDIIFKGETCPIIAEPLLAESLRSVCDHACEI